MCFCIPRLNFNAAAEERGVRELDPTRIKLVQDPGEGSTIVAVKRMHASAKEADRIRFFLEMEILKTMQHANVIWYDRFCACGATD